MIPPVRNGHHKSKCLVKRNANGQLFIELPASALLALKISEGDGLNFEPEYGFVTMRKIENVSGSPEEEVILKIVEKWCNSKDEALNWFRNTHISALGMTAEQAILLGEFQALVSYLSAIEKGGYA